MQRPAGHGALKFSNGGEQELSDVTHQVLGEGLQARQSPQQPRVLLVKRMSEIIAVQALEMRDPLRRRRGCHAHRDVCRRRPNLWQLRAGGSTACSGLTTGASRS